MRTCFKISSLLLTLASVFAGCSNVSNVDRTVSPELLMQMEESLDSNPLDSLLWNSVRNNSVKSLAQLDKDSVYSMDFSLTVPVNGITDQKNSGRCWFFSTLNILRAEAIEKHNLPYFEFSQAYGQFWDVLEKSNRFLEDVISYRTEPIGSRMNWWLFRKPIGDGGHFTNAAHVIEKYGIVPKEAMPETYASSNNGELMDMVRSKLREYGLKIRSCKGDVEDVEAIKKDGLTEIYRILVLTLGKPPVKFIWTRYDADSVAVDTKEYTPESFRDEFVAHDMEKDYFIMMNDPTREYYRYYEVEHNRNCYEGCNWKFVNLPAEDIKKIAVESLKGRSAMYFSCDVDKFYERKKGVLDDSAYDYAKVLGVGFNMDKYERILSVDSMSDHAMTLCGVDLDGKGNPARWLVENSFGNNNDNGGMLIMSDSWFEEYLFRFVAERQYVPEEILKVEKTKSIKIPAWNPTY